MVGIGGIDPEGVIVAVNAGGDVIAESLAAVGGAKSTTPPT